MKRTKPENLYLTDPCEFTENHRYHGASTLCPIIPATTGDNYQEVQIGVERFKQINIRDVGSRRFHGSLRMSPRQNQNSSTVYT